MAETTTTNEADWAILDKAAVLLWDTKMDEAEKLVKDRATNNVWFASAYTEIALWHWNYTQDKHMEADIVERSAVLEKMATHLYDKYQPSSGWFGSSKNHDGLDEDTQYKLHLTGIILHAYVNLCLAVVDLRKQSFVKGAYFMRKSWVYFKEGREFLEKQKNKGHKDNDPRVEGLVNFGIGMFHFLVSFVPPALGWLVKLLGFEANREHAGVELERAANSKCHKSIEAKMLLIALKYFFNDEEEAGFKILTELKTSLHTSPVVSYLAAFIKRLRGQIQEALDDFKQAASEIKVGELATSMNHHIGYTYFLQGNLEKAEEYLETFLAKTAANQFQPYSAYWSGYCYWKSGKKDKIQPLFQQVHKWVKPNAPADVYAERKCKEVLAEGGTFNAFEEMFVPILATHEAKTWPALKKQLKPVGTFLKTNSNNADWLALYYWVMGSCQRGLKNIDRAKKYLERAIALEPNVRRERHAIAFSHVELVEIALEEKDYENVKSNSKKAKAMKEVDWANGVSFRCDAALSKMKIRIARSEAENKAKEELN